MNIFLFIFFSFICSPGDLTSYDKEIHYSLKCPDPKDMETPCNFTIDLEPKEYFYVSKDKKDTVIFVITNKNQLYLLKSNSKNFSINRIDWENY